MPKRTPPSARTLRRRMFRRQAIVFGLLVTALVVVTVLANELYNGKLDLGLSKAFSSPTPSIIDFGPVPCPSGPEAVYPKNADITIAPLNASDLGGAAGSLGRTMETRGFVVEEAASVTFDFTGSILVRMGYEGVDAAYMVMQHMPGDAELAIDDRDGAVVDVIIGDDYDGVKPADEVKVSAGEHIDAIAGCMPIEQALENMGKTPSPVMSTSKGSAKAD
jgi:hypothetical protein